MYKIVEKKDTCFDTLLYSEDIFLRAYKNNYKSCHVRLKDKDFDIVYVDNNVIVPDEYKKIYRDIGINEVIPTYKKYDENNDELISYSLFDKKKYITFDEVNEYSIVMAKLLIKKGYEVYFKDGFIYNFINQNDKLHIAETFDSLEKESTCFIKDLDLTFITVNNDNINYVLAFHNMFFLQDIIGRSFKGIKYIKIKISSINGIGIIPIYLKKLNDAFSIYNIKVILDPSGTRYSIDLLNKIFNFDFTPKDLCDENTIYLNDISRLMLTYFYFESNGNYSYEILDKDFIAECDKYINNIKNGKKTLGLLIRGTDYISTNTLGEKRMAPVDVLLPTIEKWIKEDNYNSIFLATEDQDVLDKLKSMYGEKLHYVEQKRFRATEFKAGETIEEKEKEKYSKEEYQKTVDDTTIKYMTALCTLSKCDSFICSGMCNGYQVVKSLNSDRFDKEYLYRGE